MFKYVIRRVGDMRWEQYDVVRLLPDGSLGLTIASFDTEADARKWLGDAEHSGGG